MSSIAAIRTELVKRGRSYFETPPAFVEFTGITDREALVLLNDLKDHPHAFVIACLMDRQILAERAWMIPFRMSQRLGSFTFDRLRSMTEMAILEVMTKPEALHRFNETMSRNLHGALSVIEKKYMGDASQIWLDRPSSAEVVYRFLELPGFGPKIATMATNILARDFKIPFRDYYSIDISVDVHIRRVFTRLGLVERGATNEEVVYRARSLSPEFPGLLDYSVWEIGRNWCRPKNPACEKCYLRESCPSAPHAASYRNTSA